jgi:hypothetical protein
VNDEDEKSLLGFVRREGVNANKKEVNPVPVQVGQVRRIVENWAANLAETRVPQKRPRHVTFHLGMSRKEDIDQLPNAPARIRTTEGSADLEAHLVAVQPLSDDGENVVAQYSFSDHKFDVRLSTDATATATAMTDATAAEIADKIEKLLRIETQAEAQQIENRSVAARPSVAQLETDDAPAPRKATTPPDERIAGQGKPVSTEEDVPSVAEIGLFGVAHALTENAGPKLSKNAGEISEHVVRRLRQIEGFPETGVDLTVYGFGAHWNAMMTFAPGATTSARASVYRKVLPLLVAELRKRFELT